MERQSVLRSNGGANEDDGKKWPVLRSNCANEDGEKWPFSGSDKGLTR